MDLAIAGTIAISVVLWILSGVAQYKQRDTVVIWTVYFAIVLTILVFFLTWQKREWERSKISQTRQLPKELPEIYIKVSVTTKPSEP